MVLWQRHAEMPGWSWVYTKLLVQQMMYRYHWPLFRSKLSCSHPWPKTTQYRYTHILILWGLKFSEQCCCRFECWDVVPDISGWSECRHLHESSTKIPWNVRNHSSKNTEPHLETSIILLHNFSSGIFRSPQTAMVTKPFALMDWKMGITLLKSITLSNTIPYRQ